MAEDFAFVGTIFLNMSLISIYKLQSSEAFSPYSYWTDTALLEIQLNKADFLFI